MMKTSAAANHEMQVMPLRDASQEFKIGRHGVIEIAPEFERHFGSMQYEPRARNLQARLLPASMTNKEILDQWQPDEVQLGDFAFALENHVLLKRVGSGCSTVFFIRDVTQELRAVWAYWGVGAPHGWKIGANAVDRDGNYWFGDDQVASLAFRGS